MANKFLLDTHALVWSVFDPEKLTERAREALEDGENEIYVSAVSAFEIANKVRIGKLEFCRPLAEAFSDHALREGFRHLGLDHEHARLGGSLSFAHKDPFDRLLIAQAQIGQMTLVSNETRFDDYGVIRLW